jgi:hypothetical protein
MHAANLLAEALDLARRMQYTVREEYLDGAGGGHCYFSGKKWLLLDVAQSTEEQLSDVADALCADSEFATLPMTLPLAQWLGTHKAA